MGSGERSGSRGESDWQVILAGMVGTGVSGAVALFVLKPLIELPFWPGLIAFCVMIAVGAFLGRRVGGLLSRPSSGGPRDLPSHA